MNIRRVHGEPVGKVHAPEEERPRTPALVVEERHAVGCPREGYVASVLVDVGVIRDLLLVTSRTEDMAGGDRGVISIFAQVNS
jgi:hypothetical protein